MNHPQMPCPPSMIPALRDMLSVMQAQESGFKHRQFFLCHVVQTLKLPYAEAKAITRFLALSLAGCAAFGGWCQLKSNDEYLALRDDFQARNLWINTARLEWLKWLTK